MLNTHEEQRRLELRDATGTVVEVFVPERAMRLMGEERDHLRKELLALQGQLTRLCQERDALREERDVYLRSLHVMQRACVKPMTEEELADLKANGVSEERFLQEIETLFPASPSGA